MHTKNKDSRSRLSTVKAQTGHTDTQTDSTENMTTTPSTFASDNNKRGTEICSSATVTANIEARFVL